VNLSYQRIYIASASCNDEAARLLAADLRARGAIVTSTWHDEADLTERRKTEHSLTAETKRAIADRCAREVERASRLIVLGHRDMRGGLWEAGYAAGLGIPVEWRGDDSVSLFSARAVAS
jgi:nucleoside 2-deoxyribosyltransferase